MQYQFLLLALAFLGSGERDVPKAAQAQDGNDIAWQMSGPGGGGWIQSIAWDPRDPDVLHVGCDVGGYYFSSSAGRSYELHNSGLHDYFLEAIAIHPRQPEIILLGTESGIHRSTDRGKTWHWIRTGFPPIQRHSFSAPIGAVCFDPSQPNVVYAGIGRPRWKTSGAGAIYRSDDTGVSWRLISAGQLPADAIVSHIEVVPRPRGLILVASSQGVYRSEDQGRTWIASSEGLPHRYVEEIAVAPSDGKIVYASLRTLARDGQAFDGGVFRSDDSGRTWQSANGPGMPNRVGKSGQPMQMTSNLKELAVDPRNADVVYAGDRAWVTAGVYKTTDGGKHWQPTALHDTRARRGGNLDYGWITQFGPCVECMAISPLAPDRIAVGTTGHVFVSDDGGATCQQRYCRQLPDGRFAGNGLEVTGPDEIDVDPVRPHRLYFCYMDIGLLISDDDGKTFRRSFQGMRHPGNCARVVVDPQSPSTLWAATGEWTRNEGDLCRSEDDGNTWTVVGRPETGLPVGRTKYLQLDLHSPASERRLLVASRGNGVYESRNGGLAWQPINGNLPAAVVKEPRGLWLDPADTRHLVAAFAGNPEQGAGVYQTRDGGASWQRTHGESPFADLRGLAPDPNDRATLYVAARDWFEPKARRTYRGGLFKSSDDGVTWRKILDHHFVTSVAVNPADSRVLYVGTADHPYHDDCVGEGVLKSSDGGATWHHESVGMTLRNIHWVGVSPRDPAAVFACTSGNSAFLGKDRTIRATTGK